MTEKEIVKALECCINCKDCDNCPCFEIKPELDAYACSLDLVSDALDFIKKQQKLLTNISDLIVENTYPGFDKNGNPVSIWNADGYKKIENLLKGGADNACDIV